MLLLKLLEDHLTLVRTLLEITPKDGIAGEEFNCWTTVDLRDKELSTLEESSVQPVTLEESSGTPSTLHGRILSDNFKIFRRFRNLKL